MSAKVLQALTDERVDLQKQIGCMAGIFQLFDRRYVFGGKRVSEYNRKRLLSGQRVSIESAQAAGSSTPRTSSFSSLDCNSKAPPDPPIKSLHDRKNSDIDSRPNSHAQSGQDSPKFRNIVKDSINGGARRLFVKTKAREDHVHSVPTYKGSPRPLQLSKSVDGSYDMVGVCGKPRMSVDNGSLSLRARRGETPCYYGSAKEPLRSPCQARDGSLFSASKDTPRFSLDARERHSPSFDSRDMRTSITKIAEFPRLSLDSRERSMWTSNNYLKPNRLSKDLKQNGIDLKLSNNETLNEKQESGNHKQQPSVVAKLMGLEQIPNSGSAPQIQMGQMDSHADEGCNLSLCGSSRTIKEINQRQSSESPRRSLKDNALSQQKNAEEVTNSTLSSRIPIEAASWRRRLFIQSHQKTAILNKETQIRPTSLSVYGEIKTKLKELEFQQSNKDLRALKHIVEAIQVKEILETKKAAASKHVSQKDYDSQDQNIIDQNPSRTNRKSLQNYREQFISEKKIDKSGDSQSPTVTMKPAKLVGKTSIPASSVTLLNRQSGIGGFQINDSVDGRRFSVTYRTSKVPSRKHSSRDSSSLVLGPGDKKTGGRNEENRSKKALLQSVPGLPRSQMSTREHAGNLIRSSGSSSPRMLQRKNELDKGCRRSIPSMSSSKTRRQQVELASSGSKQKPELECLPQNDDQSSEICSADISMTKESYSNLVSPVDVEGMSTDSSSDMLHTPIHDSCNSISRVAANDSILSSDEKKFMTSLCKDGFLGELAKAAPEQPSPVSVLSASFIGEESPPSPLKKISEAIQGDEGWNFRSIDCLSESTEPNTSSKINHKKLKDIECKLKQLTMTHHKFSTDHIASLCKDRNPDHRYVTEILLASGLLHEESNFMNMELHPLDHPINPEMFLVLEQTRKGWLSKTGSTCEKALQPKLNEKLHRKLIFDTVNEILIEKLVLGLEPWLRVDKIVGLIPRKQRLLRELCSAIDQLQEGCSDNAVDGLKPVTGNNVFSRAGSWIDFNKEVPGIVLDIERLIFKDMIDELVCSEASSLQLKQTG